MSNLRSMRIMLVLAFFASPVMRASAQLPALAQTNPLVQLMLSQPPIDISSPVVAEASFDPPAVRPGQKTMYRLTFNAIASGIRLPERPPGPPQLEFRSGAQGQILRPAANVLRPFTAINFEVRAAAPGMFLMPAFVAEVYGRPVVVPAVGLEVAPEVEDLPPGRRLWVETSATNVFLGESFTVRVILPATAANPIEALREVQINGDGLIADKTAVRQSVGNVTVGGTNTIAYVYETRVTPIAAGTLALSAQGFTAGRDFGGPIIISGQTTILGGPSQHVLLESEPVAVQVRLVPSEKELPGFTGGVGKFRREPPQLSTNVVSVGDLVELLVMVRGDGNLARLLPPEPPRARGWQIFPAVTRGFAPGPNPAEVGVVFAYTLIPLSDELRETPVIPFSTFDPEGGEFADLTIPAMPITVRDDGATSNPVTLPATRESDSPAQRLALSGPASVAGKAVADFRPLQLQSWFMGVQIAPVLVIGGLWAWDRRRRFLEQHPEIVRRRRARRELRRAKRQLRRSVQSGAALDFARNGVNALRIACAPHYPADPRALVCADVLEVLPETDRQGKPGRTVRELFAAADAACFATVSDNPGELLAANADLDEILLHLEARL